MGFLAAWLFLISPSATAQCTHNPTVTPNNLIFCPSGGFDTLWTQNYQGYQWFKDGVLQVGDTLRYRRVTHLDAGSMFSVDATLNGCTERSPQVMVDGWVFLLPVVATDGLRFPLCIGDTLRLRLLPPYTMHIQWTNGGVPIPGATDDTLIVTTDGDYSVSGAPELCPAFLQQLGVTLSYRFIPCGASSDSWESTTAQHNAKRFSFEVYPNPSTEPFLYLKGNPEFEDGILRVYDYRGQNVLNLPLSPEASNIPWAENREGQTPGIRIENPVFDHAGLYTLVWQSRRGYWVTKWTLSP
jgi:hypothetical protein